MTANNLNDDWWKQAVVYQIYPRSFKDVNGDGIGDIAGVTEKMDYLKNLGVDAIWLSPFYPSDLADGGYDVIDYRNVDPRLGTMDDFDAMAKAAHEAGIKVIVDIVPNHTADKHVFFKEALAAEPGSPARDRYIFRDGPAWARVADGQWYLHLFDKAQPDVNWKNPDIHEEFKKTLRFWSDHGTDGFRIDVAHGLAKDLESKPLEELGREYSVVGVLNHDFSHPLFDRREVHDIYREWRKVFNEYDPPRFAVAEAWVVPEHQHLYASMDELGQSFNFDFAQASWYADEFREAIDAGLKAAAETGGSTTTWVMNNHDVPRSPSRYGLPQVKGAPYHQLPHDWLLCAAGQFGTGASFGFSPAVRADGVTSSADPHLPQPLWFKDYAVDVEQADPDSMLTLYHAALAIRQESLTATRDTTAEQVDMGPDVVAYTRAAVGGRTFTSITNFGTEPVELPGGSVVLTSGPLTPDGQLPTDTSAWVIK